MRYRHKDRTEQKQWSVSQARLVVRFCCAADESKHFRCSTLSASTPISLANQKCRKGSLDGERGPAELPAPIKHCLCFDWTLHPSHSPRLFLFFFFLLATPEHKTRRQMPEAEDTKPSKKIGKEKSRERS